MEDAAAALIARLAMSPHPEGGWYRETWRAEAELGERAGGSAILFLLTAGQRSHWHTVDAAELWLWHAGTPLALLTAPAEAGPITDRQLGPDILAGETPQLLVEARHWQSAEARHGWALGSCVVVPAFDYAGFRLAPSGWSPGG